MWSKRQCNNKHERGRKREEIKIAAYERTWKMKIWQINLCKKNNGIFGKKIWEGTRLLSFVHGLWEQYLHLLRYLEYKTALSHRIDSLRSSRKDFLVNFAKLKQHIFRNLHDFLG